MESLVETGKDPESLFTSLVEIGRGSFGAVYKGICTNTRETIAVKKVQCPVKKDSEEWQEVMREIEFLSSTNHMNCVKHFGSYLKGKTLWIVLEFCVGSASDILDVFKAPLTSDEIAAVARQTVEALVYLHECQRIHRDIKAANILFSENGVVKLADFGSASLVGTANTFIGTPYWMAPEVIMAMEAGTYTGASDLWSLGITCIELAQMKPPLFELHTLAALYQIPSNDPPVLKEPDKWPKEFSSFLASILVMEPKSRIPASELISHPFVASVTSDNGSKLLADLIIRSKRAVKELDRDFNAKNQELLANLNKLDNNIDNNNVETTQQIDSPLNRFIGLPSPMVEEPLFHRTLSTSSDTSSSLGGQASMTIRPQYKRIEVDVDGSRAEADVVKKNMKVIQRLKKQQKGKHSALMSKYESALTSLRSELDREYLGLIKGQDLEMDRLRARHRAEADKLVTTLQSEEKTRLRDVRARTKLSVRDFSKLTLSTMELKKTELREQRKAAGLEKDKEAKKKDRDNLMLWHDQEIAQHEGERQELDQAEMAAFQAECARKRQLLDEQHSRNEGELEVTHANILGEARERHLIHLQATMVAQMTSIHSLIETHITDTQSIESQQLETQHDRDIKDLTKRHENEMRKIPKRAKAIKTSLRKQYNETVKMKMKQGRAMQQILADASTPADRKEVLRRKCEEENRKLEETVKELEATENSILKDLENKLRASQLEESNIMKRKHESLSLQLKAYHSKRRHASLDEHSADKARLLECQPIELANLRLEIAEEKTAAASRAERRSLEVVHRRDESWIDSNSLPPVTPS